MSGSDLSAEMAACRAAHERLHRTLDRVDDLVVRQPSRLPGWTVGHVLTHLARNADSVLRRLRAAERGELVTQYEGGAAGREAEIEAGHDRPAADIVADLRAADAAVDEAFAAAAPEVWARTVLAGDVNEIPATRLVFSRWREVEVHHVDLGLGYGPAEWPDALVARWLPELLEQLPDRTDRHALTAWLLGRAEAPEVRSWG
ncbi:maleylpyruvate isomerase family mycothiol-dependent enzyme [Catellatospora sp. KI3]|uniref:maleylpyruvate isomerase N-terminal domain-containing protein n=1 Tax=Catellatospora sp. KI3 TaxID=3041620 RepID=UPI002482C139|nr:maleylpyruvate isomerase N-terminal domain-containing protein [Catellatospora sp. KI3]MDI1462147.1 maleylpyruvate isomerase family mycothiol-dependent enzyme [Catellatospora sp. KI3]